MKIPKISVIIPVYNGEKTLRQCLNSVLNQTYGNYEIIIVNNNSTDKTKEIIKEFQLKNTFSKRRTYLEMRFPSFFMPFSSTFIFIQVISKIYT